MPRTVLETLVVRIVGEVSSYKRMMRQVPQMAQVAAKQVERTTVRSFNKIGGAIDRAIGSDKKIRQFAKAFDRFDVKVNRQMYRTWGKFGRTIDSVFGRAGARVDAFGTRMQRRFQLLPRTIGRKIVPLWDKVGKSISKRMEMVMPYMRSATRRPFWTGLKEAFGRGPWRASGGRRMPLPHTWNRFQQGVSGMFAGYNRNQHISDMWRGYKTGSHIRGLPSRMLGGVQRRMGAAGQLPFWAALGTGLRPRSWRGQPATWSQFRQLTAGQFRGNLAGQAAAWKGQKIAQGIRGGVQAVPGMVARGARAIPGLAMAGGAMALRGARAVPGMAMAGARGAGGAAMAGMRAMPKIMGNAVGMAGAAMGVAARRAAPILRGMLGGLGRGLANSVGLLAGAFTGRFIPALHSAGRVGNLWYSNFRNQVRRLGYDLTSLGQQISLYITAPLAALGVFAMVQFAKFDDAIVTSMSLLENIGPGTRGAMEKEAFRISGASRTGPTDLAHSYFHLASAGFEAAEAIGALATVEKFAIAGAFDLNESGRSGAGSLYAMNKATTLLVDSQAALGLRTADTNQNLQNMIHVGDVLTKANIIANARVEDFAKSITTKSGAAARRYGKDIEELTAILATYAMQGVKAESAGEKTYIFWRDLQRSALRKPAVFQRLGVRVFDENNNDVMRSSVDILRDLERAFGGMSDKMQRATFMEMGFQDRSLAATMQLLGFSDAMQTFDNQLRTADKTMDMVANRRLKSLTSQMMMTYNQIRIAAIGVGKIFQPAMLSANQTIRDGVKWWNSLSKTTQKWVVFIGAFVAAIGPAVFALGLLAKTLAVVFAGLTIVSALFTAWTPFVATILAIGAAIAVLVYLIAGQEGLVGAWQAAIKWVSEFATQAIGFMENFSANMRILWDWFRNNWQTIITDSISVFAVFTSNMIMNLDVALQTMIRMFVVVLAWIVGQWERCFDTDFGRWAAFGIVNVTVKFVAWVAKMKKLLASVWSGEEVDTVPFIEKLTKDIEKAATAQTFQQLMDQLAGIYNEGMAKMRRPLQGMKFDTPAGPKFLFNVPKELEEEALEPIKAMQTMFNDLHDELDEPFNAHFTVSGIEAVEAGTVEALARLVEFRQLKVPSPVQGKIAGAVEAMTGVAGPINRAMGVAGGEGVLGAAGVPPAVAAEMTAGEKSAAALLARGQALATGPGVARAGGFGGGASSGIFGGPVGREFDFNAKGIRTDAVEEILKRIDANIEEQKEFIEKNPNPFMTFGTTSIGANS